MAGFGTFIVENLAVIKSNWGLFFIFGLFCISAACTVLKWIYDNILYKDLPEKRELEKQIEALTREKRELKEKNDKFVEELRDLRTDGIFLKATEIIDGMSDDGSSSAAEKIRDALFKGD